MHLAIPFTQHIFSSAYLNGCIRLKFQLMYGHSHTRRIDEMRMKRTTIFLSDTLLARAKAYSLAMGAPIATLIRTAVEDFLTRRGY
jgi:hypothetical protein